MSDLKPRPTDAEYEATRLEFHPHDLPAATPIKNDAGMYPVEEIIHHGDYYSRRVVEVYALNETTVDAIIQSSAYCYGSWANAEGADDLKSHRRELLKRLVQDLKEGRVNRSIGWSTFRVLFPGEYR
jgi:hypothetical protein